MITADAGLRGGKMVPLKRMVDEAISISKFQPEHVLVCNRHIDEGMSIQAGRDLDYGQAREKHLREEVGVTWLESGEPSYLLYTSGTTAHTERAFSGIRADTPSRWRLRCDTYLPASRVKQYSRRQISGGRLAIRTVFTVL